MSEKSLADRVMNAIRVRDPIRVENPAHPGTPDVNYVDGWIELKAISKWPARDDTPVTIDHFTPEQRVWLLRRWSAGGCVHLLLQVGRFEFFLFRGHDAAEFLGRVDSAKTRALAAATFKGRDLDSHLLMHLHR